eukprot:Gregarina_sp_Poly_1__4891@NODE_259_length_10475_cov_62_198501_g226_i0_p5_GENE_NODE_259_length_10475_cov_62_198501_g226_i0NODE_259_length_10475_cov_62_198501_g226_i0_p5_ORF_typecomplete_len188_score31_27SRPRB/PF09439_10/2_2e21Arf/PF00025_21/6_5e14FeoB_N/PF02421_18/0_0037Gtr1_RagA/PF04670_12/0_0011MMR_HSR1/PF01926_23/0_0146PF2K/PF01591_18/0_176PF2K/PF01591_18/3_2e02AAA_24/PF13479_6/0_071Mg_chelatase/PF01078_21/0_14_NODE_259_length_10475_cov_62_198501_g226_i030033566
MDFITVLLFGCLGVALLLFLQFHLYSEHGFFRASKSKELRVLLLGLPNSGKTLIWQKLTSLDPPKPTVASLEPNSGIFVPSHIDADALTISERRTLFGKINIKDLPGRFDQQAHIIEDELSLCFAFIFILDSCDPDNIRAASSFLFNVLSSTTYQAKPKPVCLFFNKQNLAGARHKNLLREDIEREM